MKRINFFFSFCALALFVGCSHKLEVADSQLEALTPAAAEYLNGKEYFKVPSFFPISDEKIIEGRNAFNASEIAEENLLIEKYGLKVDSSSVAGVPILIIRPETTLHHLKNIVGFNIHGGAFVMGTARDRSALLMAGELGITIYSVDYSLAPEVKYPVAIDQCLSVYRELIKKVDPKQMIAISSSSGGTHMLSMLLNAQKEHLALPKAQVLFTPASDLSGAGDSGVSNDGRDFLSTAMSKRMVRDFYLGGANPKDPGVSPIYGSYEPGFPSSVIVTGTRDLMLSNGVRLYWKLKEVNVNAELLVGEGMWHGFHWQYSLPESIAVLKSVKHFVYKEFGLPL